MTASYTQWLAAHGVNAHGVNAHGVNAHVSDVMVFLKFLEGNINPAHSSLHTVLMLR